jgi:hypothetical protein
VPTLLAAPAVYGERIAHIRARWRGKKGGEAKPIAAAPAKDAGLEYPEAAE